MDTTTTTANNSLSETPTTILDFEHLLDFGPTSATGLAKPLACARCHGQKLRCVRSKTSDGRVCDRCLGAGVECVSRQPQRIGRPADLSAGRYKCSSGINGNTRRRRGGKGGDGSISGSPNGSGNGLSGGGGNIGSRNNNHRSASTTTTMLSEVDGWTWPLNSPSDNITPNNQVLGGRPPAPPQQQQQAESTTFTSYGNGGSSSLGGSSLLAGGLASPSGLLLPGLDDLAGLFPWGGGSIDAAPTISTIGGGSTSSLNSQGQSPNSNNFGLSSENQDTPPTEVDVEDQEHEREQEEEEEEDDPVEHLSRLQLELYHCLLTVKSVEKMKKERLRRCDTGQDGPLPNANDGSSRKGVDTSWSENLFCATERFIEALRAYVDAGPGHGGGSAEDNAPGSGSTNPSPKKRMSEQMDIDTSLNHRRSPSSIISKLSRPTESSTSSPHTGSATGSATATHIDTATGLMIISCYTRLVQIYDVVVFVVETYTKMSCPGDYVQLRFGGFAPKRDKTLKARILGQYVLHLLEGVSEAVEMAVSASRQPYARAVAEVRRNEAKLRERVQGAIS
ncbi:hypothetical protein V8F20_010312 [Naviculisporaceae sp. PSN 640]